MLEEKLTMDNIENEMNKIFGKEKRLYLFKDNDQKKNVFEKFLNDNSIRFEIKNEKIYHYHVFYDCQIIEYWLTTGSCYVPYLGQKFGNLTGALCSLGHKEKFVFDDEGIQEQKNLI